ncbi:MAG: RagB/SusD family nutrient uptake outer membrane protein [Cyclobacteriaceae bacterium]|nr:RagB/SusD family nutrient uptake outer membrane protein [Cyclobacteriaceae bacterium]
MNTSINSTYKKAQSLFIQLGLIVKKAFLLLIMLFTISSCSEDFLEWVPVNAVTAENYYQNEVQMQKALNAAYSAMGNRGMYGWWLPVVRIIRSDNTSTSEAQMVQHSIFTVNDTDRYLFNRNNGDGMWNSIYIGILRCNLILIRTNELNVPNPQTRNLILGQARFLRALYNYHLVTYWNRAPLMLEQNYNAIDVPLSDALTFYSAIENDLKIIIDNEMLPWTYDGSAGRERGRASMGSAFSLLGKIYLFQGKYAESAAAFDRVVSSNVYSLIPVNNIFSLAGDNGPESVFEIQFSNANAGPNPFFDDGVNAAETTLRNQTLAPNQYNGWENAWPTQSLVDAFEPGDLRRAAFIVVPGENFPTRTEPFAGTDRNRGPYAIKKGMGSGFSTGTPNGTGEENFPVIRYADVLLMYAEALIRANTDLNKAADLIDLVRARAFGFANINLLRDEELGINQYAQAKSINLFEALKHERRVELCFEGHRYTDLQRWGDAASNPILRDRGWTAENAFYPISREDIDLSSLIDNE